KALWFVGLVTVGLTSFYMFRLWYLTFFGEPRYQKNAAMHQSGHAAHGAHGVQESTWIILLPLVILGVLSLIGGWIGWPAALGGNDWFGHFLRPVFGGGLAATPISADFTLERTLSGISLAVAVLGWLLADRMYRQNRNAASRVGNGTQPLYRLVWNKYWVDEIYGAIVVAPLLAFSRSFLARGIESGVIDGTNNAWTRIGRGASGWVRRMQSGNIRSYAGWLAAGAAAVLLVVIYFSHLF
ncbi:MAG TPA: hypothetical protein VN670_08575, partial [Acidobacteriaceae bacterium]|nr:hypothetical protein [Acidobacteriaceae bacterium]